MNSSLKLRHTPNRAMAQEYVNAQLKWHKADNQHISRWRVPKQLWKRVAKAVYLACGSEGVSLRAAVDAGDWKSIASRSTDLSTCHHHDYARRRLQADHFLKKFPGLPGTSDGDRKAAAFSAGREAERQCLETNRRLRSAFIGTGKGFSYPSPVVTQAILAASRKIRKVLGPFKLDELLDGIRWGPGGSSRCKNPEVSPYHKFVEDPEFTTGVRGFASALMAEDQLWAADVLRGRAHGDFSVVGSIVRGNRITTAPKTALTDRLIAVEPHWNILFQLSAGTMIRNRLRRHCGIDLDDQTNNQMGALLGSLFDNRSTIDLKAASDTLSWMLVRLLLVDLGSSSSPSGEQGEDVPGLQSTCVDHGQTWFRVLNMLRSPESFWPDSGTWERNEKFSSMGNGFTFELESLIFWALASSIDEMGHTTLVYGDDIVVAKGASGALREVFEFCGFTVNTTKSFTEGPFRESCGGDYFNGVSVTPFRLKKFRVLADAYVAFNGLCRVGMKDAANEVLAAIPEDLRFWGPRSAGDVVLHTDDFALWDATVHGAQDQWFFWGLRIKCLRFDPYWTPVQEYAPALLANLYNLPRGTCDRLAHLDPSDITPTYGRVPLRDMGVWVVGEVLIYPEREERLMATQVARLPAYYAGLD